MKRNLCSECGKPCRGKTCMACIQKRAGFTDYCHLCGARTYRKKGFHTCRACGHGITAAKLKGPEPEKREILCIHCGKPLPWRKAYKYYTPKYCGTRCQMLHSKASTKHTKESVLSALRGLIQEKERYVTFADVNSELHMSDKVLVKFRISLKDLNKEYGYGPDMVRRLKSGMTREDYLADRQRKAEKKLPIKEGVIEPKREPRNMEILRQQMVSYIREKGHGVSIRTLLDAFNADYYCTWKRGGFSIDELIREAGVPVKAATKSYYEDEAEKMLREAFPEVVSQARFTGCVSPYTGRKLRFDFYIPQVGALIEVNGEQHYNPQHFYWTSRNNEYDRVKEAYSKQSNKRLIQVPIKPAKSFYTRFRAVITGLQETVEVTKPVELLERSLTQSAAKPDSNARKVQRPSKPDRKVKGSRVGDSVPEAAGASV